jgi:hypothetical protein
MDMDLDLKEYFQNTQGISILATADAEGRVDAAIYSRPYMLDDDTLAFIMADRLTRKNLQSNPFAAFLFLESTETYEGKRLFLTKIKEGTGEEETDEVLKQKYEKACQEYKEDILYLVYFKIDKVVPLVD